MVRSFSLFPQLAVAARERRGSTTLVVDMVAVWMVPRYGASTQRHTSLQLGPLACFRKKTESSQGNPLNKRLDGVHLERWGCYTMMFPLADHGGEGSRQSR
jgi:hypothetical protein